MTLEMFLEKLMENFVLRNRHGEFILEPKNRKSNKKLAIFVDDANNNADIFEVCKRFNEDNARRLWC